MNEKKYIDGALIEKELRRRGQGICILCQKYNYCLNWRGSHKYCWQPFELPAADVAEVKHGEWEHERDIDDLMSDYRCSNCNFDDTFYDSVVYRFYKYCPYCGAKMDGGIAK